MAGANANTAMELLVYIHHQLEEFLTIPESTDGRRWPPEVMREDLFGQTLHYKLVELKRTGYAVPDTWWNWLPRPEGFFLILDNPHEVARLEMEVESAIKALEGKAIRLTVSQVATKIDMSTDRINARLLKAGVVRMPAGRTYSATAAEFKRAFADHPDLDNIAVLIDGLAKEKAASSV